MLLRRRVKRSVSCQACGYLETLRASTGGKTIVGIEEVQWKWGAPSRHAFESTPEHDRFRCFRAAPGFDRKAIDRKWDCAKFIERKPELESAKEHFQMQESRTSEKTQQTAQARLRNLQIINIILTIFTILAIIASAFIARGDIPFAYFG